MTEDAKAATRPDRGRTRGTRPAPIPAGPAPTQARLRDAALAHLARFASTRAGLVAVLDRRIQRWSRRAQTEGAAPDELAPLIADARHAARLVADALVGQGVLDDAAYAESRTRSLSRGGRSRRAIAAHLSAHGIAPDLVQTTLAESPNTDLAAAVLQTRRRRIGAFAPDDTPTDPASRNKALSALARAGFDRDTAERALDLDPEEAERIVLARHAT